MWFWFVPKDVGSFTAWTIGTFNPEKSSRLKAKTIRKIMLTAMGVTEQFSGSNCFGGGDGPIQMAQGRIVRWDKEELTRTDRAVLRVRQIMKDLHQKEVADREAMGLDGLPHRVERAGFAVNSEIRPQAGA